jgi:hypothetical protein
VVARERPRAPLELLAPARDADIGMAAITIVSVSLAEETNHKQLSGPNG